MRRPLLQAAVAALIALLLGVAGTAAALVYIPDSGSAPSIFDDFNWSSTANGYWHVNAVGSSATIKNSTLSLVGDSIELDRRVQTDPLVTVTSVKVRAQHFGKFGLGLGIYHSGTIGMEFDADGIKCGRGTDHGYHTDFVKLFHIPPTDEWFYLQMRVVNPYPNPDVLKKLGDVDPSKLKKVTEICSAWDSSGNLLGSIVAHDPPPNTHYAALDEAYLRTWDNNNKYQVDWFYAGPPTGDPLQLKSLLGA